MPFVKSVAAAVGAVVLLSGCASTQPSFSVDQLHGNYATAIYDVSYPDDVKSRHLDPIRIDQSSLYSNGLTFDAERLEVVRERGVDYLLIAVPNARNPEVKLQIVDEDRLVYQPEPNLIQILNRVE